MSGQFSLFLFLVLPVLIAGALVFLAIFATGAGTIAAALRSAHPAPKAALLLAGILIILSPFLYQAAANTRAESNADQREASLADLERVDLAGRLPDKFITVGNFGPELISEIETRYRLRTYDDEENQRLTEAYRAYRQAELCHRRFPGNPMMPGTRLPKCKPLPASVQAALALDEPVLVFAEGRHTSLREDNILAGQMYEIRLITADEDLLVAYYEERTVEDRPGIFNPYASGRRNASDECPPTLEAFIEIAMQDASR